MPKNKAAVAYPEAAIDGDGMAPGSYIEASIKSSGLSREEWFKRFNEGIAATDHPANITDGPSFQSWLDERYSDYKSKGVSNDGYGKAGGPGVFHDMLTINRVGSKGLNPPVPPWHGKKKDRPKPPPRKDLLYDTGWQYKATLTFPVSWLDDKGKTRTGVRYADLSKGHYIARKLRLNKQTGVLEAADGGRVGDIYKVWDPTNPGQYTYAMLADGSPSNDDVNDANTTEVTGPVITSVGMVGTPNKGISSGSGKLVCKRLGPSSLPKQTDNKALPNAPLTEPTDEQILRDGARLDGKPLTPEAAKSAGAFQLLKGEQTVLLGPDQLCAGYADVTCIHTGGGYIAQGSQTVFIGTGQWPSARVDDPTSDGYFVATGAVTVEVG